MCPPAEGVPASLTQKSGRPKCRAGAGVGGPGEGPREWCWGQRSVQVVPHTCAARHPHLGLGRRCRSCRFWHLAGVCSLVGLGHRGTPTSALHTKSGLRPGAWSEGPKGPVPDSPGSQPRGLAEEEGGGMAAGPRDSARNSLDPPAGPRSTWAGWPLGSLQVVQASSTPPAPGALGPSGAAAQAGPWLRAEASP